ncbi:MAG: hypothetical protein RSA08_04280 [Clostridia bacterium]
MKKKEKLVRIIISIALIMVVFITISPTVQAAINTDYYENNTIDYTPNSGNLLVNSLTEEIGKFIFGIFNFVENVFSSLMGRMTKDTSFPWADKIIFNAVPMLDPNFINPDANSLLKSGISEVIQSVYGTLFTISISFFGIVVALMAIKMATSAIASEKAKYKEGIVNWLKGLILIFTVHYLMSFIFYANESMVKVFSGIAVSKLGDIKIPDDNDVSAAEKKLVVDVFVDENKKGNIFDTFSIGNIYKKISMAVTGNPATITENEKNYEIAYALITNKAYQDAFLATASDNDWKSKFSDALESFATAGVWDAIQKVKAVNFVASHIEIITNKEKGMNSLKEELIEDKKILKEAKSLKTATVARKNIEAVEYVIQLKKIYDDTGSIGIVNSGNKSVIRNLSSYFKDSAMYRDETWRQSGISIGPAIMYAILIVQSLLYFFAYIKRLFYIIVLGMLAPLIVVYDFFTKTV